MITNLNRAGPGLGEYQFNKDLEVHFKEIVGSNKIQHDVEFRNIPIVPSVMQPPEEDIVFGQPSVRSLIDRISF